MSRRRVALARSLDEPTAGMNESETAEMTTIIGGLKAQGRSIPLIEHKLDPVMRLSDRVIAMDDGRLRHTRQKNRILSPQFGDNGLIEGDISRDIRCSGRCGQYHPHIDSLWPVVSQMPKSHRPGQLRFFKKEPLPYAKSRSNTGAIASASFAMPAAVGCSSGSGGRSIPS